jgi:hypothetical protein
MRYKEENIWLTQKLLATLYDVDVATINEHLKNIFSDRELTEGVSIRKFLIVQQEGNRTVRRKVNHYNLQAIIALGFKVNNDRAVQFRKWAGTIVKDYTIQGWVMDVERLKNGGSILIEQYFEWRLEKIREIRLLGRRFYQKFTDLYVTALSYDATEKITRTFFATVQNKMHYAVHGNTAAKLIVNRANYKKLFMDLALWDNFPNGKIQKYDASNAKNCLEISELDNLERIEQCISTMPNIRLYAIF